MTRRPLPGLGLRATRVRLLAWTLLDALVDFTEGDGSPHNGSRMMLYGELWPAGSYAELDRAMGLLTSKQRRAFIGAHVDQKRPFESKEWETLAAVAMLMPENIYVPAAVSEAAGFAPSDAKIYAMPRGDEFARRARLPRRRAA